MADQIPWHGVTLLRADRDFRTAFGGNARPLNAFVDEGGELMRHPLEDGSQITDHLVIRPTQITMPVMIQGDYRPIFEEIRQAFRGGVIFTVIVRGATYRNMILSEIPHEETTEIADALVVNLRFGEAIFIKTALGGAAPVRSPRRARQGPTAKRGQVQAAAPTTPRGSLLYRKFGRGG